MYSINKFSAYVNENQKCKLFSRKSDHETVKYEFL